MYVLYDPMKWMHEEFSQYCISTKVHKYSPKLLLKIMRHALLETVILRSCTFSFSKIQIVTTEASGVSLFLYKILLNYVREKQTTMDIDLTQLSEPYL